MNTLPIQHSESLISNSNKAHGKWIAGSAAILSAVATTPASAGVVQITLSGEIVTDVGGITNTFTGDFTGDGIVDTSNMLAGVSMGEAFLYQGTYNIANAQYAGGGMIEARVAGAGTVTGPPPLSISGLFPVTFKDARINGGVPTAALIDVRASGVATGETIQVVRSVFNDASTAAPVGGVAGGTNREFDPTVYAQRISLASKIRKLKKKAKKAKRSANLFKAKKLKNKLKKLNKRLAGIA